ncbi:Alg9-like mannosyltransferase family-domain-containing protein [Chytriomyces cf. hyalinus JEL632]|nr:Alg9-like mannosyltransferase family-domain-containing protein [Chytriomyces cf. hyalinus JEL632]
MRLKTRDSPTFPSWIVIACIIGFRTYNALLIKTFFSPDEYWQSLEIAHEYVFGYGHLTWEWTHRVRGFAHPMIFAAEFKALELAGLDDTELMIIAPKLIQAVFAAVGDVYTFMLAQKLFGKGPSKWALFASLVSFFNFFCGVRTFSNSIETSLTAVAMYYWPWTFPKVKMALTVDRIRDLEISLACAGVACILRPTNAIIWMYLGFNFMRELDFRAASLVVVRVLFIGSVAAATSCIIDHQFYNEWTFVPYNFFKFNLTQGIASFYGIHTWHWYLSQGIPIVLFTFIPATAWTLWSRTRGGPKHVRGVIVGTVVVYSVIAHKEFRFVMPLLPLALAAAGNALYHLQVYSQTAVDDKTPTATADANSVAVGKKGTRSGKPKTSWMRRVAFRAALGGLVVSNAIAAFYLGVVHQRGVVDVMTWLRRDDGTRGNGVLFLMPCHSTPFHSHVHKKDVEMRFLTCEPPLDPAIDKSAYLDEADIFYADPKAFIETYFAPFKETRYVANRTDLKKTQTDVLFNVPGQSSYQIQQFVWPSRVVIFAALLDTLGREYFIERGYSQCARFFNSHFHDDSRRLGDVVVYCVQEEQE